MLGITPDVSPERAERLPRLSTKSLLSASGLADALERAMDAVEQLTRFPAIAFFLLDEPGERLDLVASRGFSATTLQAGSSLPVLGSLSGVAVRTRELATSDDVSHDPRTEPVVRRRLADEGFTATASVPLLLGDRVVGVMNLIYKAEVGLSPFERRLITSVARVVAIGIDRHRARAELAGALDRARQSESRFATTLRSIGDAVIATDTSGRITFMNAEAERVTGWSLERARGRAFDDVFRVFDERTRAPAASPVERVLREGAAVQRSADTVLVASGGAIRSIEDNGAAIRDDAGAVTGAVLVVRDVSDARRVQRWRDVHAQATNVLASLADAPSMLVDVARLGAAVADWCVVDLVERGGIRRVAGAHSEPSRQALVDALVRNSRIDARAPEGVARAIRTGEAVLRNRISEDQLRPGPRLALSTRDPEHLRLVSELGWRAFLSVPLVAHGRVLGAMTLVASRDPEAFGPLDLECAEVLASRCAMAIESSRLIRDAAGALAALARTRRKLARECTRRRRDLRRTRPSRRLARRASPPHRPDHLESSWKGPGRG